MEPGGRGPHLPLGEGTRWRGGIRPPCGNPRAQSGTPCWMPPRQGFQWRTTLQRWSGPGEGAQPGGLSQLVGENETVGLPCLFQHGDSGGPFGALAQWPVVPLSPLGLSLQASLWLHLWAPGELPLLCCVSALVFSSGEALGVGAQREALLYSLECF